MIIYIYRIYISDGTPFIQHSDIHVSEEKRREEKKRKDVSSFYATECLLLYFQSIYASRVKVITHICRSNRASISLISSTFGDFGACHDLNRDLDCLLSTSTRISVLTVTQPSSMCAGSDALDTRLLYPSENGSQP